jgi:uncharacterized protein
MTYLQPPTEGIPLPSPTALSAPFWEGCAAGKLMYQECQECRTATFPPGFSCRSCPAEQSLRWRQSRGVGKLYASSTVWRPQSPAFRTPYVAAIVELDEGYAMLSNLIDCELSSVDSGMTLRVEFVDVGSVSLPFFTPIDPPPLEKWRVRARR